MPLSTSQAGLFYALRARNTEEARTALEEGARADWVSDADDALTPMQECVLLDFIDGLEVLLAAGGNVDFLGLGHTPLMLAANLGRLESGRWLLNHGANAHLQSRNRATALTMALVNEHLAFAGLLLQERPELLENINDSALAALEWCQPQVARWLLDQGADPDLRIGVAPATAHNTPLPGVPWLCLAQRVVPGKQAQPEVALSLTRMLLAAGADPNIQDDSGSTALHYAIEARNGASMLLLLHAGANPDVPDANGHSARERLASVTSSTGIHDAFHAWEASGVAQQVLQIAPAPAGVKAL